MKISAGLLMYRLASSGLEVFLVHPGGPFFRNKDKGWWTIPKGLVEPGEDYLQTAIREFTEETGIIPQGPFLDLGDIKQKGRKTVHAWAFKGAWDAKTGITCNSFEIEWPPKSGKMKSFPEIDEARWMNVLLANEYMNEQQQPFLERLQNII